MKKTVTTVIDDYTGKPIKDGAAVTITLSVNGKTRQLDLSAKSAKQFHQEIDPWLELGSVVPKVAGKRTTKSSGPANSVVRAWAAANGYDVAARGRIPVAVVEACKAATGH